MKKIAIFSDNLNVGGIQKSLINLLNNYKNKNVLIITHGDICKAIYLYFNPNTK